MESPEISPWAETACHGTWARRFGTYIQEAQLSYLNSEERSARTETLKSRRDWKLCQPPTYLPTLQKMISQGRTALPP
jgi:hypothetical protein